ncbi:MAG: hypothetical protein IKI83_09510 [Prevotella sp.]|nr:hypothetical protein [Prevotella sp.]
MSFQDEIKAIISDASMPYEEKREKLLKLVTPQEVRSLLPEPIERIALKEPLKAKESEDDMRILNLSVVDPIFESILQGGHVEYRDYNEYYKERCTYEEDGIRYLVPFDAINFFVGRGKHARKATVTLRNIECDGTCILFYTDKVLRCQ